MPFTPQRLWVENTNSRLPTLALLLQLFMSMLSGIHRTLSLHLYSERENEWILSLVFPPATITVSPRRPAIWPLRGHGIDGNLTNAFSVIEYAQTSSAGLLLPPRKRIMVACSAYPATIGNSAVGSRPISRSTIAPIVNRPLPSVSARFLTASAAFFLLLFPLAMYSRLAGLMRDDMLQKHPKKSSNRHKEDPNVNKRTQTHKQTSS